MPSLEIAGLTIGVREGVLALIFLVALYIGLVLFRMRRLTGQLDQLRIVSRRLSVQQARMSLQPRRSLRFRIPMTRMPLPFK